MTNNSGCVVHVLEGTGRTIQATFSKPNVVKTGHPVVTSEGEEAYCRRCGKHFICHRAWLGFAVRFSEIDDYYQGEDKSNVA